MKAPFLAHLIYAELRYDAALKGIRELIRMESEPDAQRPDLPSQFRLLTNGDAAEITLLANGNMMKKTDIFDAMRSKGHPISTHTALATALCTDGRFTSLGRGFWALKKPPVSSNDSTHEINNLGG